MQTRLEQEGLAVDTAVPARQHPTRAALSFAQRYVWAHQQVTPHSTAYNLCLAMHFEGEIVDDALRQAFLALPHRHEVLRTTYHDDERGNPYQLIHDELPPRVETLDLTGLPEEEANRRLTALMDGTAQQYLDVSHESSMRLEFVRMGRRRLVVVLVIHHIAWDGMAMFALSKDVERFYHQALGDGIAIEPLPRQVADFAEWEQENFRTHDHRAAIDFWETRFDGATTELRLPYNRRPTIVTERGSRLDRPLGAQADRNLRELSATLNATPFAVFLAAYYLALRQITGQSDVVVGTTVANREQSGMELLIGNFSNVLPLRLTGTGAETFADLVVGVRDVITETFRYKDFPREGLVHAVNRATGNVGSTLFETMVLFLHKQIEGPQIPGVVTSSELADHGAALLPISVEAFLLTERVDLQITYRTDLFDAATIERLHEYIDQMLASAAAATRIDDLLVLSASDRAAVQTWSRGDVVPIERETVDAMIRGSASAYPDRIAVVFGAAALDYAEFDARVNRFARLLIRRGVRCGDRVGVYAERSDRLPVLFAAVLRAGGAYVPIDPAHPSDRIEFMLADAQPVLLVGSILDAGSGSVKNIPVGDLPVIDLDDGHIIEELDRLDHGPIRSDELARPIHPLDAAYLLYTSGTTGRPKGVVNNHRAVANHVQWMRDYLGFGAERILQKAPIGFDVSVFELVNALCTGSATVVPPPDWWQADVAALVDIIDRHRITQLSLLPSVVRAFLDAGPDPDRLRSVRFVYLGGEAVPPQLVAEAAKAFGGRVLGLYGPTEAAMDVTHEDFAGALAAPDEFRSALIGLPEWNSTVYVLDERLRQVPIGVVGELYLGGIQLARGYHRRPGRSCTAFVACPFADEVGARMYRTGDIARWHPSGSLEYLGRVDDQVKIRGHRVELEEIGTVLRQAPCVAAGVVTTVDRGSDTVLVGYYVAENGSVPAGDEIAHIRAYLGQQLPDYMGLAALIPLEALPRTANGKLDMKALPTPDFGASSSRERELRGSAEQTVAEVIGEVLGISDAIELAGDDDFLALGGDSITAMRMAAALDKRGLHITTSVLFEARTIALIAAQTEPIDQLSAPELADSGDGTGWIPLNPIATLLTEQSSQYCSYVQATAVVTPACSSSEELRTVVRRLVDRHPMLRARIAVAPDGSTAYYVPVDGEPFEYPELHEVEIGCGEWERDAAPFLREQVRLVGESLDPHAGNMVGAVWVRTENGETGRLLLVMHHLIVDGVSWRIIHDELRQLWGYEETGLASSGTSVQTWNANLAQLATADALVETLSYWEAVAMTTDPLLGARDLDLAVDTVGSLGEVTVDLDSADTGLLMTTATEVFGCDFLDIQVAALAVAVHRFRWAKDRDVASVALTMERHGRAETLFSRANLANTVGWFTSAYPAVVEVTGGVPAGEVDIEAAVQAVKEQLRTVPDSGMGWGLLRWLNPQTRVVLEQYRPPQVAFNYMGRFAVGESPENVRDWDAAPEFGYLGGHADSAMPVAALMDINTVTLTEGDRATLRASLRFPTGAMATDEAHELAQLWVRGLRELAGAVRANRDRRLTPSDVLAHEVTQFDLNSWRDRYGAYEDVYPLAPLQAGLYFTALAAGSGDAYNAQTLIGIRGELDLARLSHAVESVVNGYPNLRVAISVSHSGHPYAIVVDHLDVAMREIDLASAADADKKVDEFLRADLAEQFPLAQGPLIRVTVLHLPDGVRLLVLTMHHLLGDGWSGQLLPREIFAQYSVAGAELIGDPATFAKFLTLMRDREDATEAAWQGRLDGVRPCLVAPGRIVAGNAAPGDRSFAIDKVLVDRLTGLAAELGATFSTVCQLAWANVLRYVTGADDTVFGEAVSGRPPEIDGIDTAIGCFANTVPVAIGLRVEQSWRQHLAEIQSRRVALMEYPQYRLTSALRSTGARKLFDSMCVFESYPSGREELERLFGTAGLELASFGWGGATDNALLLLIFPANSLVADDQTRVELSYATDAFDAEDARVIETIFGNTLHAIAEEPDGRVGDAVVVDDTDEGSLVMRRMWQ